VNKAQFESLIRQFSNSLAAVLVLKGIDTAQDALLLSGTITFFAMGVWSLISHKDKTDGE
jgi:hypothetical protein